MKIGDKINTNLGKLLVLSIKKSYLILFDEIENRFVKANNWHEDYEKVYWEQGKYYNSFDELILNINI